MKTHRVVELLGDGISAELSQSVRSVIQALSCSIELVPIDLSEGNRKTRGPALYDEAVAAMRQHGVAIKYPTATPTTGKGESPNKVLRDRCHFAVIHRPVCTIPGIQNNFKKTIDIDVVRIATGGTYEDAGRRIGRDTAVSLRVIERAPCRFAARFAFKLAMIRGTNVTSASKHTIQRETDGLFEEAVGQVAEDYPSVPFRRELFDALLAGIIMNPERYAVIVCPNEYGDFLSDTACGLIGSIGLGDSSSYAFDDDGKITLAMFDPAGGTAPDIAGRNLANPTAALLSLSNLLRHLGEIEAGANLRRALLEAISAGRGTRDVGGPLGTKEFTAEIAERLQGSPARA